MDNNIIKSRSDLCVVTESKPLPAGPGRALFCMGGHPDDLDDAAEIVQQIFAECGDPTLFGYGVDMGATKQKPQRANPLDRLPPFRDRFGKRRWATISRRDRLKHALAERPLFTAGCANRRQSTWKHFLPLDQLFCVAGVLEPAEQAANDVLGDPRILPRSVVADALRVSPARNPAKAAKLHAAADNRPEPIRKLLQYLISLDPGVHGDPAQPAAPEWWHAGRLLRQAAGWKLTPHKWAKITVDIDGDRTADGSQAAQELGASIILEHFEPLGIPAILGPSRSRTGAYVDFFVALDGMHGDDFNAHLDGLANQLRARYAGDSLAHVCSVKGKLAEWLPNPEYDPSFADEPINENGWTRIERYEWRRRNATDNDEASPIRWSYDPRLEPLVLQGKVDLITAPLHGIQLDADGGKRRVESWRWLLDQRKNAPTAAQLFEMLRVHPVEVAAPVSAPVPAQCTQPPAAREVAGEQTVNLNSIDNQRLQGADGWKSYAAAARIAIRRTRGDVEKAAHLAVQIREQAGVSSGMSEQDPRILRASADS